MPKQKTSFNLDIASLKALLKQSAYDQAALAAKMHIRPETLSRYISKGQCLEYRATQIAAALGVDREELRSIAAPHRAFALTTHDIHERYKTCRAGDVVSIVSPDGFLEAEEDDVLFERMVKLVQLGGEVRYFYPSGVNRERFRKKGEQNKSQRDFGILRRKFAAELSPDEMGRVAGLKVSPQAPELFGWETRYVVFASWNQKRQRHLVREVLLYVKAGADDGSETPTWIRLAESAGCEFYRLLQEFSEPVQGLGISHAGVLNRQLQEAYREQWSDPAVLKLYKDLRQDIGVGDTVSELVAKYFPPWWDEWSYGCEGVPQIRLLDVGAGTGETTEKAAQQMRQLSGDSVTITPLFLEPSRIPEDWHEGRLNAGNWIRKPLEDRVFSTESFDIIMAIHSCYLMDPWCYLELYDMLSRKGMLIIVLAPHNKNLLNLITSYVDSALLSGRLGTGRRFEGKVTQDEHRIYAEDLEEILKGYFGENFECLPFAGQPLRSGEYVDGSGIATEKCMRIARMFASPLVSVRLDDDQIRRDLGNRVREAAEGDELRAASWGFVLRKNVIRERLRHKLHGRHYCCVGP